MDALDTLLIDAWNRVSARVRADRVEALKRAQRRFRHTLWRPVREWCLVIRASDTRINEWDTAINHPRAFRNHQAHTIELTGKTIRRLTKPVTIAWPGVTYEQAAKTLGRSYSSLNEWARQGALEVAHYREYGFPEHGGRRGRYARRAAGHPNDRAQKPGRPYVWTPSPIDPNNFHGRPPHAVWGTLWQGLGEKLPENYQLVVKRVPRFRRQRSAGGEQFLGWEFVCPGRLNQKNQYMGCGRRCTYLYGPQTVWTLPKALGLEEGFDMPPAEESGLAGQWFPGLSDPIAQGGPRSFACKKCWRVRSACMANESGWNDFITQISGGLLRGRDVKRPLDICPLKRRKRGYQRRRKTMVPAAAESAGAAAG